MILFSLMMLSMLFVMGPRAAVSAGRIGEVLSSEDGATDGTAVPKPAAGVAIEFENVTFRYPGADASALENVSFSIPEGQVTALIGGTGSGKTTVLQLIARFHEVTEGRVLVDGLDVRQWPRAELRRRLGLVPQKARLFTGTVASNLRWGAAEAGDEALQTALDVSQASQFVADLPQGLEGQLDKGGANLSGGQKQRLTIARALVRKPAALLFDDSFSALDVRTDAALRAALEKHRGGSTVVVVAQRVSTVRGADRIVVLDDGRVAGVGTHAQLLTTCPVYEEIVASQEHPEATDE
jgi:ATP-binding cassette subfamily B protein